MESYARPSSGKTLAEYGLGNLPGNRARITANARHCPQNSASGDAFEEGQPFSFTKLAHGLEAFCLEGCDSAPRLLIVRIRRRPGGEQRAEARPPNPFDDDDSAAGSKHATCLLERRDATFGSGA